MPDEGFYIKGLDEFYERLKTAKDTSIPNMLRRILESLGAVLLRESQTALKSMEHPHARFEMKSREITRGKNKGQKRNYLAFVGTQSAPSIDTGGLWGSFNKGGAGNIWNADMKSGNFRLVVGSNLEHAKYINDGFKRARRWVPGVVDGNGIFRYQPGAKTGIMLKEGQFRGVRFFDVAFSELEKFVPEIVNYEVRRLLDEWGGG
jgi:hypothetical protein